jgi:hypothetical protein
MKAYSDYQRNALKSLIATNQKIRRVSEKLYFRYASFYYIDFSYALLNKQTNKIQFMNKKN